MSVVGSDTWFTRTDCRYGIPTHPHPPPSVATLAHHGRDEVQDVGDDEQRLPSQAQLVPTEPDLGVPSLGKAVRLVHRLTHVENIGHKGFRDLFALSSVLSLVPASPATLADSIYVFRAVAGRERAHGLPPPIRLP